MFISLRRKKEIGIRKVLGAKPTQILALYSNDFIKKVGLSILIGIPTAYFLMTIWLSNFKYHISFTIWILIIPCIVLSILTIVSLSFESLKMTRINPINLLKDE